MSDLVAFEDFFRALTVDDACVGVFGAADVLDDNSGGRPCLSFFGFNLDFGFEVVMVGISVLFLAVLSHP